MSKQQVENEASTRQEQSKMRVMLRPDDLSDKSLRYVKLLGVDDLRLHLPDVPDYRKDGYLRLESLLAVKKRIEEHGLRIATCYLGQSELANLLLGRKAWEAELDNVCRTIETMGKAALPVLEFSLLASRAIRSTTGMELPGYFSQKTGRGHARLKSFDQDLARGVTEKPVGTISADQMWERITRFQHRCVPVADESRVHLACHPDDPPIDNHWGINQVLRTKEGLQRLIDIVPSPYNGLLLCLGTMQESGADVLDLIRHFGRQQKIFDIDFRNVRGVVPRYDEVFLDEGDLDMWKVVRVLREVGYSWTLELDHVPQAPEELGGYAVAKAWTVGYMRALVNVAYP